MKQRTGYFVQDDCFELYCVTKCPLKPDVYVGSVECHKCENFISEKEEHSKTTINCKK